MKVLIFILMIVVSSACSSVPKEDATSEELDFPVIDVHTHTAFTGKPNGASGISVTREQYLKDLQDARVIGTVSHNSREGEGFLDLASVRVLNCAGVAVKVDVKRIEEGLKSGKYRCLKIYLGYVHQWAYDKNYEPAYALAEKYDVPVVFHTGDNASTKAKVKYADPLTVDEVAVDHPKVKFILAHGGNPWIESAAEVAYKNPNVYIDLSAFMIGDLTKIPDRTLNEYVVKPIAWIFGYVEDPGKLMFGTDWPLVNIAEYAKLVRRAIPKEHWRAVFHDNAVRVFKIQ